MRNTATILKPLYFPKLQSYKIEEKTMMTVKKEVCAILFRTSFNALQ